MPDFGIIAYLIDYHIETTLINKNRKIIIIFAGNLSSHKGFDLLNEFWLKFNFKDISWKIYGDGPLKMDFVAKRACFKSNVSLKGKIFHAQMMEVFSQSDYLILPSRNEAFGQVVIEAMCQGCIPIVGPGTGAAEIVQNSGCGYVLENLDVDSMAKTINRVIHNWKNGLELSPEEVRNAVQKYDTKAWIEEAMKVFEIQ